jgi:hypothetical protein
MTPTKGAAMLRKQKSRVIFLFFVSMGVYGLCAPAGGDKIRIWGRVTDFANRPISGATVELNNSQFRAVAKATSGEDGRYALSVPKGNYMGLIAVKDYQTKFLEYWAWNVPAQEDLEINPRFDRLEVYALNAWRPQGAYPSYQIYFRPMSLTKVTNQVTAAGGMENFSKLPLLDMAPDLRPEDIAVTIDSEVVKVLRVSKIKEAAGPEQDMIGYIIQAELPKQKTDKKFSMITVTLTDHETGEKGEASLFIKAERF